MIFESKRDTVGVLIFFCAIAITIIWIVAANRSEFQKGQIVYIKGEGMPGEIVQRATEPYYLVRVSRGPTKVDVLFAASQISIKQTNDNF